MEMEAKAPAHKPKRFEMLLSSAQICANASYAEFVSATREGAYYVRISFDFDVQLTCEQVASLETEVLALLAEDGITGVRMIGIEIENVTVSESASA